MSRRKRNIDCNFWDDAKLPPCASFLGSYNPLIKNEELLYRNYNRLYMFLSFNTAPLSNIIYNPCNPNTFTSSSNGNIQISTHDFLIGIYLDLVYREKLKCDRETKIHENEEVDKFIRSAMEIDESLIIRDNFIPSLSYAIANSNSILPLYTANFNISLVTFYIILMLNRSGGDLGLLWGNNSYVTPDSINYELASLIGKR